MVRLTGGQGNEREVDVAAWLSEDGAGLLVSVVNPG